MGYLGRERVYSTLHFQVSLPLREARAELQQELKMETREKWCLVVVHS